MIWNVKSYWKYEKLDSKLLFLTTELCENFYVVLILVIVFDVLHEQLEILKFQSKVLNDSVHLLHAVQHLKHPLVSHMPCCNGLHLKSEPMLDLDLELHSYDHFERLVPLQMVQENLDEMF